MYVYSDGLSTFKEKLCPPSQKNLSDLRSGIHANIKCLVVFFDLILNGDKW